MTSVWYDQPATLLNHRESGYQAIDCIPYAVSHSCPPCRIVISTDVPGLARFIAAQPTPFASRFPTEHETPTPQLDHTMHDMLTAMKLRSQNSSLLSGRALVLTQVNFRREAQVERILRQQNFRPHNAGSHDCQPLLIGEISQPHF